MAQTLLRRCSLRGITVGLTAFLSEISKNGQDLGMRFWVGNFPSALLELASLTSQIRSDSHRNLLDQTQ